MSRLLLSTALCLTLGACVTAAPAKLAVCDGRHRRPANPNGSVLTLTAESPAAPAKATPKAGQPGPSAALGASFRPCGGRA